MADFRRYQPRHGSSASGGWGKWLVAGGAIVLLLIVGKFVFGGRDKSSSNSNANSSISLVTDNANLGQNTNGAPTNSNEAATLSGSWADFSTTTCPKAVSSLGTKKQAVLTVGLSAANDQARQAIAALKSAGVSADFLSSGTFASNNGALLKEVRQAGFAVYSQSYDGTNLTSLSDEEVVAAIRKADDAISAATGSTSKPVFRPPSGSYNDQVVKLLNQEGYCAILWTVDAYDWQDGMTAAQAQERVLTAIAKQNGGVIIALHAGYDITPQLITDLSTALKSNGYDIVTLAAALNSSSS